MKINIKASGFELTPAITEYVESKISPIDRYLDKVNENVVAQVEVGKETHHKSGEIFRAEIHITGNGLDLYAVTQETDLYAAIDTVRDEIAHNIVQAKGKREAITRRSARAAKDFMKGITDSAAKGFSWGVGKLSWRGFKKRP